MATLSTTAWVLHELGLAAGFGGNLFGQLALNPAVAEIQSQRERGKVTHVAWDRYKVLNGASLALMAGTWFAERALHGRRALGGSSPALTVVKDVLVGGALATGIGSMVVGRLLDKEVATSNEPLRIDSRPSSETRRRVERLQRLSADVGRANILVNAAILGISALLAVRSR